MMQEAFAAWRAAAFAKPATRAGGAGGAGDRWTVLQAALADKKAVGSNVRTYKLLTFNICKEATSWKQEDIENLNNTIRSSTTSGLKAYNETIKAFATEALNQREEVLQRIQTVIERSDADVVFLQETPKQWRQCKNNQWPRTKYWTFKNSYSMSLFKKTTFTKKPQQNKDVQTSASTPGRPVVSVTTVPDGVRWANVHFGHGGDFAKKGLNTLAEHADVIAGDCNTNIYEECIIPPGFKEPPEARKNSTFRGWEKTLVNYRMIFDCVIIKNALRLEARVIKKDQEWPTSDHWPVLCTFDLLR
tara:strand:+ start:91 stop:999 length:909 start_codon:yes stop_codon:yes gene_type:complete